MEVTDKEILAAFANEKTREIAFGWLMKKYQQRLYWQVRRMVIEHSDADDVMQNVLIKVWRHLEKFRNDSSLHTWLYRISSNECLTFLEQKKKRQSLSLDANEDEEEEGGQIQLVADPYFDGDDIEHKLQRAILTLPDKQRIVFNLRYYDEMPYEQMSEVLDTSVGALKASYHHAAKKIEAFLTNL